MLKKWLILLIVLSCTIFAVSSGCSEKSNGNITKGTVENSKENVTQGAAENSNESVLQIKLRRAKKAPS